MHAQLKDNRDLTKSIRDMHVVRITEMLKEQITPEEARKVALLVDNLSFKTLLSLGEEFARFLHNAKIPLTIREPLALCLMHGLTQKYDFNKANKESHFSIERTLEFFEKSSSPEGAISALSGVLGKTEMPKEFHARAALALIACKATLNYSGESYRQQWYGQLATLMPVAGVTAEISSKVADGVINGEMNVIEIIGENSEQYLSSVDQLITAPIRPGVVIDEEESEAKSNGLGHVYDFLYYRHKCRSEADVAQLAKYERQIQNTLALFEGIGDRLAARDVEMNLSDSGAQARLTNEYSLVEEFRRGLDVFETTPSGDAERFYPCSKIWFIARDYYLMASELSEHYRRIIGSPEYLKLLTGQNWGGYPSNLIHDTSNAWRGQVALSKRLQGDLKYLDSDSRILRITDEKQTHRLGARERLYVCLEAALGPAVPEVVRSDDYELLRIAALTTSFNETVQFSKTLIDLYTRQSEVKPSQQRGFALCLDALRSITALFGGERLDIEIAKAIAKLPRNKKLLIDDVTKEDVNQQLRRESKEQIEIENVMGPKQWKQAFGVSVDGKVPEIPEAFQAALKKGYFVTLIPKEIDGQPFSLAKLLEICRGKRTIDGEDLIVDDGEIAAAQGLSFISDNPSESRWVCLHRTEKYHVGKSDNRNTSLVGRDVSSQKETLRSHYSKYEIVSTLEEITALLMHYQINKKQLLDRMRVRTRELDSAGNPIVVSFSRPKWSILKSLDTGSDNQPGWLRIYSSFGDGACAITSLALGLSPAVPPR